MIKLDSLESERTYVHGRCQFRDRCNRFLFLTREIDSSIIPDNGDVQFYDEYCMGGGVGCDRYKKFVGEENGS